MRFYWLPETADAQVKGCGVWVHFRTTLFGIAPGWWYRDRRATRPTRRLGVEILTPAAHYDRFTAFSVTVGKRVFRIGRDHLEERWGVR